MKTSKVISCESQEHFWHVVRACLQEFHDASRAVLGRVSKLRQKIDTLLSRKSSFFSTTNLSM